MLAGLVIQVDAPRAESESVVKVSKFSVRSIRGIGISPSRRSVAANALSRTMRKIISTRLGLAIYSFYAAPKLKRLLSSIKDPQRLEHFGWRVFSQNEEDGIISEIFRRIGTTDKCFIEFGCADGRENNSRLLLEREGWHGLWMDGRKQNILNAHNMFREHLDKGLLRALPAFITQDNINELIHLHTPSPRNDIDLLVIDIDGNDAHVWKAITIVRPRVVCIEYNAYAGPFEEWTIDYDPQFRMTHDNGHIFGASLKLLDRVSREKGYTLVGCNITGVNAFFVRDDLLADKFVKASVPEFFHPPRFRLKHSIQKALGK